MGLHNSGLTDSEREKARDGYEPFGAQRTCLCSCMMMEKASCVGRMFVCIMAREASEKCICTYAWHGID